MKLGDKVIREPETFCEMDKQGRNQKKPMKGTIVYIHPQGRYHTVEFETEGKTVRESFWGT